MPKQKGCLKAFQAAFCCLFKRSSADSCVNLIQNRLKYPIAAIPVQVGMAAAFCMVVFKGVSKISGSLFF